MAKTKEAPAAKEAEPAGDKVSKFTKDEAISILTALGYNTVETWKPARLAEKLNGINDTIKEEDVERAKTKSKAAHKLLVELMDDLDDGCTVIVEDTGPTAKGPTPKGGSVTTKSGGTEVVGKAKESENGKDKKGDKLVKSDAPKRPGVIQTILECLRGASSKNPVTKDDILKVLVKRFPDRPEAAMKSTLNSQVPSGLRAEKDLECESKELPDGGKGWWLPK